VFRKKPELYQRFATCINKTQDLSDQESSEDEQEGSTSSDHEVEDNSLRIQDEIGYVSYYFILYVTYLFLIFILEQEIYELQLLLYLMKNQIILD
jgi:hypothetical protein